MLYLSVGTVGNISCKTSHLGLVTPAEAENYPRGPSLTLQKWGLLISVGIIPSPVGIIPSPGSSRSLPMRGADSTARAEMDQWDLRGQMLLGVQYGASPVESGVILGLHWCN